MTAFLEDMNWTSRIPTGYTIQMEGFQDGSVRSATLYTASLHLIFTHRRQRCRAADYQIILFAHVYIPAARHSSMPLMAAQRGLSRRMAKLAVFNARERTRKGFH